jgi:hypothetical protein
MAKRTARRTAPAEASTVRGGPTGVMDCRRRRLLEVASHRPPAAVLSAAVVPAAELWVDPSRAYTGRGLEGS